MAKTPKEFEYDHEFPDNVDPNEENRRKFTEDKKKALKEDEKAAKE